MRTVRHSREGFTLLEVIIAVGIMTVLLLAVYQSIVMYYAQLETGREIAEQAQLVRSLSQRISLDVRSSFTRWKPTQETQAAPPAEGEEGEDVESEMMASEESAVLAAEYQTPEGGVLGYPDSVTLVIRVPPADLDFTQAAGQASPVTDVRMVRYWLATGTDNSTGQPASGLVREELYRMPDPSVGADPRAWARAEVLAEEVVSLAIRYFDGSAWRETWDNTNSSAPMAVEFILGLTQPTATNEDLAGSEDSVRYYRVLTSLPDTVPIEDADAASTDSTASTSTLEGT